MLRSRYWHRLPGQYFMDVLEAFLRVNEARFARVVGVCSGRPTARPSG